MKKTPLIVLFLCAFGLTAFAQTTTPFAYKNAIKLNPVGFGNSEFQLSYERYFGANRKSSIMIMPSVILKESNDQSKKGWQLMAQYRFFLTHFNKDQQKTFLNAYNYGFYAGVYGLNFNYKEDYLRGYWEPNTNNYINKSYQKSVAAYEGGALLGLQIDITKRILIDFYIGGGLKYVNFEDTYTEQNPTDYPLSYGVFAPEYSGVKPRLGLLLGFTF